MKLVFCDSLSTFGSEFKVLRNSGEELGRWKDFPDFFYSEPWLQFLEDTLGWEIEILGPSETLK